MASPRVVIFPIFDGGTKVPLTGQTPTFLFYSDENGNPLTPPAITEIGGGFYKFTPTLQPNHVIVYMLDCGAGADGRYPYDAIRAEDFDEDLISGLAGNVWEAVRDSHTTVGSFGDLMQLLWLVFTSHVKLDPMAGTLSVYGPGDALFQTQTIKNAAGAAGGLDATERLAATRPG
jgi:hypothetical protein